MFSSVALLLATFGLSVLSAWLVGRAWSDSRVIGGWLRIFVWVAAALSSLGFNWCYAALAGIFLGLCGFATPEHARLPTDCGCIAAALVVVGVLTALYTAYLALRQRRRDIARVGQAAWETYTKYHSEAGDISFWPDMSTHLKKVNRWGESTTHVNLIDLMVPMVYALFFLAASLGSFTASLIIRRSALDTARLFAGDITGVGY